MTLLKSCVLFSVLVLASTLCVMPAQSQQDTTKGAFLYQSCEAIRIVSPTPVEVDLGNRCMAYIEGFVDGEGPIEKYKCLAGVTYPQMVMAYIAWMEKNPEYLTMSKRLGVEASLMKAFCFKAK